MTDYAVGIDRGTNQDSKTLNDICDNLRKCSGGTVTPLGIGPNKLQSYALTSASKGKTGVYITNGVGLDTPEDFSRGIGSYYHLDKCIFVWPQWIGNQYMSDDNILNHKVPREHDFTSVQFGVGGQTATQYFPQAKNVELVAGPDAQTVANKICSGNYVGSSGNTSSSSTNAGVEETYQGSPLFTGEMTFEELVGEICNGIDLMFLCKKSTVVVTDFETIFAEAKYLRDNKSKAVESEDLKLWNLEEDSYELEINQHGFYNTVYVNYKDGVVKESYEDFVRVYGEVPITYNDPSVDKSTAIMKAKAYLSAHLRDLEMSVNATMLADGDIDIGDIVTLENPLTMKDKLRLENERDPEYLFVKGVTTNWDGEYISSDLECQFSPTSPKKLEVPTVGSANTSNNSSNNGASGSFNQCGISTDGSKICAIGKPSAPGEGSYGYEWYRSIYENKCPFCGGTNLVWDALWSSNNYGYSSCKGSSEGGSLEGHIFCKSCDADFSCIEGKDHENPPRATLTRVSGPDKSSYDELQQLKAGTFSI